MKKYTLFFLIFTFIFSLFSLNLANAQSNVDFNSAPSSSVAVTSVSGCLTGDIFSRTTGQACSTATLTQCRPGDLFNSVTGKSCSSTATASATVTAVSPVPSSVSPVSSTLARELSARLKSQGADVTTIQQFLKDEGYLFGNVDGKFGKITGRAVGDFQEDNDMQRTEIVDAATRTLLNSKIGAARKSVPVISGVSGPQFLNVGQTGTWTVKASNPGGGDLSYLVNWGDEINRLVGQRPSLTDSTGQSATFSHTYEEAGEYTPTFYVTNTSSQRAQTSLSVKVESVSTRIVSEQVKCVFEGSTTKQSCYTTTRSGKQYTFSGVGTAGGTVSGYRGEILTWKSSCGGYAYTTLDRQSDYAKFDCNTSSPSLNVLLPNGGETWTRGDTEIIAWQHNTTNTFSTSTNALSAGTYDIRLFSYAVPCTSDICPMFSPAPSSYTIASRVYGSSYRWVAGDVLDKGIGPMDGIYGIEVCQSGTKICDSSDSYFKLESETNSQLSIVTSSIPDTKVGAGYAANIYAKGGNGESYYWRISSGSLPPGLSLFQDSVACIQAPCPNTGPAIIAGTPTASGSYSFTVEVSAGRDPALIARQNFSVNVEVKSDASGSLSIDPASVSLKAGNSSQVKAFYMPACPAGFACIQSIQEVNATWSMGNKSIADVMYAISDCNPTFAESGCVSRTYVSVYGISRGSTELSAVYQEKNGNHVKKTVMVTVE